MITAIDLAKLRNAEFLQFGATIAGLTEANNPDVLNVGAQCTAFKSKLTEMSGLFKLEKASPITEELVLLDERRDRAIIGLTSVLNGYCNHFGSEIAQPANLLTTNLNLYGVGVARMNTQAETSTINGIVNDWETKPELSSAITILGLNEWVLELKTANQLFEKRYLQRTQEYGAANPDTLKSKREETMVAYYGLRRFIEANGIVNPSDASEKLIKELNALIDQYNLLIASRPVATAPVPTPAN